MQNANMSASERTRFLAARTLAVFHQNNPNAREGGRSNTFDSSSMASRVAGQHLYTQQTAQNPVQEVPACCPCTAPGEITNFNVSDLIYPSPPPYDSYDMYFELSWDAVVGATSYTVTSSFPTDLIVSTGATTANLYITNENYDPRTLTLTANSACGQSSSTGTAYPCFLAGSLVHMADGSTKAIEDVVVGDEVLGAFGETNIVLALHRPLLGTALMCRINDEHSTTNHHPHISVDRQFYCGDPELVSTGTYGRSHMVLDGAGVLVERLLLGLTKERIRKLACGVVLKTVEGGRCVNQLETYALPEDTQLYNLVVGGSHTYHVDGYAVTGWPREDDFDYDAWVPRA